MSIDRLDAMKTLLQLRETVSTWRKLLDDGDPECRDAGMQTSFLVTLQGSVYLLNTYLTQNPHRTVSEVEPFNEGLLLLGGQRSLSYTLADGSSFLIVRYPTVEDPRIVYLGSLIADPELANREVSRRWKTIDVPETRGTLFGTRPGW